MEIKKKNYKFMEKLCKSVREDKKKYWENS